MILPTDLKLSLEKKLFKLENSENIAGHGRTPRGGGGGRGWGLRCKVLEIPMLEIDFHQ